MKVAWIGTGVMGGAMMLHLKKAGHEVFAFNRTKEKAEVYQKDGIHICDSIAACIEHAEVIFTIVGYPRDVEEVYHEIFQYAKAGTIAVDMTTSSPSLAVELYALGKAKHLYLLDAPVSGGDQGAKAGTLSIMAGGDEDVYEILLPLLETMGTPHYMGKAGSGQHTKACNQIGVAGAVAAMSEAIHYARINGLDEEKMLTVIAQGAAGSWQMSNTAPRVLQGDFTPGFYIKHFIKDMHIIQNVMKAKNEHLDLLDTVCASYEKLAQSGHAEEGTQSLIKYYES